MMSETNVRFGLTSFQLKIIAIITMLADHAGIVFFQDQIIFRIIGRISFPIFAFLLVEGFCHTKNIKKYLLRIFALAILSEIPFDLLFYGTFLEFSHQNVFFTLFLALLALYFFETLWYEPSKWGSLLLLLFLSEVLHTDYSYTGILMVFLFYLFRKRELWKNIGVAFLNVIAMGSIQAFGVLALLPIHFYSGTQGRKMKYFFYAFYPAHLLILFLLRIFI